MKISVLIPAYNEENCVGATADALVRAMDAVCAGGGREYEIIFSNDGSSDNTLAIVENKAAEYPGKIRAVSSPVNRGKGSAVRRAVLASEGDAAVFTDCDLAYGTEVIGEALGIMETSGADLVIGSRALHPEGYEGYTGLRKVASKAFKKLLALRAGFKLTDSQCGFKVMKGDVARDLFGNSVTDGWSFDFEILMLAGKRGYTIREMPVKVLTHRESRIRVFRDSIRMSRDVGRIKKRIGRLPEKGNSRGDIPAGDAQA